MAVKRKIDNNIGVQEIEKYISEKIGHPFKLRLTWECGLQSYVVWNFHVDDNSGLDFSIDSKSIYVWDGGKYVDLQQHGVKDKDAFNAAHYYIYFNDPDFESKVKQLIDTFFEHSVYIEGFGVYDNNGWIY